MDDLITLKGEKLLTLVETELKKEYLKLLKEIFESGYERPSGEFSIFRFKIQELKSPSWVQRTTKNIVSKFIGLLE